MISPIFSLFIDRAIHSIQRHGGDSNGAEVEVHNCPPP